LGGSAGRLLFRLPIGRGRREKAPRLKEQVAARAKPLALKDSPLEKQARSPVFAPVNFLFSACFSAC
jgi:hypothetical protein